jgi:membrane dipeptidase
MRTLLTLLLLTVTTAAVAQEARIERLLQEVPLVDGHNDLPWQYQGRVKNHLDAIDIATDQSKLDPPLHTDIPRLRRGHVGAQFWSAFVPTEVKGASAVQETFDQIDLIHRMTARYPDTFAMALTADDVVRIHKSGKIASLIGVEGGHSINNSLATLRQLYAAGARYMTLTHSTNVDWADSATADPVHDGLTEFGKAVVTEMNRLGMFVDLSHVSASSMHDALDATQAPVLFTHSSARAVTGHSRNVPDDVLQRLKQNGGVVMVTFVPSFVSEKVRVWQSQRDGEEARLKALYSGQPQSVKESLIAWDAANPRPVASLSDVADHVQHILKVAGEDHVGIGGDFDGIRTTPAGLEDVSHYPALLAELSRRGLTETQLRKLVGQNVLRAMKTMETVAARLQKSTRASDARIEELDKPAQ